MPEISKERLAYFETLEALMKEVIEPFALQGKELADAEYKSRFARSWTDEEIEQVMNGSSIWDDPPKGWRKPKLLTYSRGELVGRGIVGGNVGQYFHKITKAVHDPVGYWRRWRLGLLEFYQGIPCSECGGTFTVDQQQIVLRCSSCGVCFTYEQIRELERPSGNNKEGQGSV